jgi:hypothetical protein
MLHRLLEKLRALLEHEHLLHSGIDRKIRSMVDDLYIISGEYIYKCNYNAANLVSHVRELFFDIEDWADLFALRVKSHEAGKHSVFDVWFYRAWNELTMILPARSAISDGIEDFQQPAHLLTDVLLSYNHDEVATSPVTQRTGHLQLLSGILHPISLIGQERLIEKVTKKLKNVIGMGQLNILCITGMAGSAKSTLAAAVYQRLQQEFVSSIFVSIGSERNMVTKTLKNMLRYLENQGSGDVLGHLEMELLGSNEETGQLRRQDIEELTWKIRESLKNKRHA